VTSSRRPGGSVRIRWSRHRAAGASGRGGDGRSGLARHSALWV